NVVDGGKKLSTSGSDQIHHILPHHGTVPGPSDPLGPPSDVIGDGKRLSPTRLNLDHHGLPPLNPPSNVIGVIGIDGENRFSIAGSDQIHHILPHHGTVPGPSPPSDKIGDGKRLPPSGPSPNHNNAPPVSPPSDKIGDGKRFPPSGPSPDHNKAPPVSSPGNVM
uniref:Uncharacterized protein n=1 Tax=Oryza brachyantha TaxID=4533 RepID=J3M6B5_ORYBR